MESESRVVKRTVRSSTIGGGDLGDSGSSVQRLHHYQVYRGMSPTTTNRMEIRLRELEEALDIEREARIRAEKDANELHFQFESMQERIDEADGLTSAQSEISRKREQEVTKLRKDMELIVVQHESQEASLRKRHQDVVNDLTDQLEQLGRARAKADKDKQTLVIEIDAISSQLDSSNKARAHAESKADGLEDQLRRLKAQVEELTRVNNDLNGLKARLTQENFELQRQVQELDNNNAGLAKAKSALQSALDDAKSKLDEETRVRNQLTIQINSLQADFDNVNARLEEEADSGVLLRSQLLKAQGDLGVYKSKYEKEIQSKIEEMDDLKRRLNARIMELEEIATTATGRAGKLEKDKNRLQIELRETTVEMETAQAQLGDCLKRLKSAESANADLARRVDELTHELQTANADNGRLNAEVARLKISLGELTDKNDALARENRQLSEALREAQQANKDLTRQVQELITIRVQLEGERDGLAAELGDCKDALRDAQMRADAASNALSQLRSEMEVRLREKDDELDNVRKASARALDELQRTLVEIETKYKGDLSRLKKRHEAEIREYEIQVETLGRTNNELAHANKGLSGRVKELELSLDEERRAGEEARAALTVLERKRIALTTELEDVRSLLETSERSRKNAEGELAEANGRVSELSISVTALTGDKRRLEADFASMHAEMDDALNARRGAEDRADRLQAEVNRLVDELRQEQENYKNAEALRKSLEVEIREITVRLEEAEAFAQREGKRLIAKLQARLRDLEAEFEAEQRKNRDLVASNRKLERSYSELRVTAEDDRRLVGELQEAVNSLSMKVKTLRRQLEEAEEVVTITMNKYRKAMSMVEDAEHRADQLERSMSVRQTNVSIGRRGPGQRSASVTREVHRVVRL